MQVLTSTKDIEMWGDGKQTRSFTFIDDCVEGILRITKSDFKEPLNLGSSEMVRPVVTPLCLPSIRTPAVHEASVPAESWVLCSACCVP